MDTTAIYKDLAALPPEAQQEVADFIAFLRRRIEPKRRRSGTPLALAQEPFVGMWRDRPDMQDSSAWVRETRRREWGEPVGQPPRR